jgi:ATP-binding cassette subfamily B protein
MTSGWRPGVRSWWMAWRLARFLPRHYLGGSALWIGFLALLPILTGLTLAALFDRIGAGHGFDLAGALWLCLALVVIEAGRGLLLWGMVNVWPYWWQGASTLLRANVIRSIVRSPGAAAGRLPGSPGEAVSRLRDDVDDLVIMTDIVLDVVAAALFAVVAFAVMLGVDPTVSLVLLVPLVVAVLVTRGLGHLITRWHRQARERGARVTSLVGELFAGILAVKTAGAEAAGLARLSELNRRRRTAAVRDRLAMDLVDTVTGATAEVSIGLVLLLAVPAMRRGDFTVGDLALFTSYVGWLTQLPRFLGRALYRFRQGEVATQRLGALLAEDEPTEELVRYRPVWFRSPPPPPAQHGLDADRLEVLEVTGLTARHPGSEEGIEGVDLRVERGSFTVLTGPVGAGKTTLVRALLGLVPRQAGTILWNGRPVDDPATFLVPPRAAYAGQVPRLFSASLEENIRLGWPASSNEMAHALSLAALDRDVAEMPEGWATLVGPRGMRLSGGQVQRATAARALVRMPELLVVDDLSSALDVETEELLWRRLAAAAADGTGPSTMLVVSHRQAALQWADQVVELDSRALSEVASDRPSLSA